MFQSKSIVLINNKAVNKGKPRERETVKDKFSAFTGLADQVSPVPGVDVKTSSTTSPSRSNMNVSQTQLLFLSTF